MAENLKTLAFLVLDLLASTAGGIRLQAQSGIYNRIGVVLGHGALGSLPEEDIDLFMGNVALRCRDIYLPGPNRLDVEVCRVSGSKILEDCLSGNPVVQAAILRRPGLLDAYGHGPFQFSVATIEFPDDWQEIAYPNNFGLDTNIYLIRASLEFDKTDVYPHHFYPELYFKKGVFWIFSAPSTKIRPDGTACLVTLISVIGDAYGHFIHISNDPHPDTYSHCLPTIRTIIFV